MNFENYQKSIYRAIPEHENEKDERLHWAIGLCEEVGEVFSVLKHHYYGGEEFNKEELVKEMGDVLWYTAALAVSCGVNLQGVAELNEAKLRHRFPNEFDNARSADRHGLEKKFSETDEYKEHMEKALKW